MKVAIHQMGLYGQYFKAIQDGKKTVEVRLNDEKRRKIKRDDTIEFIKVPEQDEKLEVRVMGLKTFNTFQEMYQAIPFKSFDCEGWTMAEMLKGTYDIYSREQEKEYGTVAITIRVLH